jgi:hypothetical protein
VNKEKSECENLLLLRNKKLTNKHILKHILEYEQKKSSLFSDSENLPERSAIRS